MRANFVEFLMGKGAFDSFVRNLSVIKKMALDEFLGNHLPIDYVLRAFSWEDSPEKYPYWNAIDVDWREFVNPSQEYSMGPAPTLKEELEDIAQEMIRQAIRIRKLTSNIE